MGVYLDSKTGYALYKSETEKPYFVDKTLLLKELFPLVEEGSNYVCVTRPRRFGKTVMCTEPQLIGLLHLFHSNLPSGFDVIHIFNKRAI